MYFYGAQCSTKHIGIAGVTITHVCSELMEQRSRVLRGAVYQQSRKMPPDAINGNIYSYYFHHSCNQVPIVVGHATGIQRAAEIGVNVAILREGKESAGCGHSHSSPRLRDQQMMWRL
jgi:hypothetical protein